MPNTKRHAKPAKKRLSPAKRPKPAARTAAKKTSAPKNKATGSAKKEGQSRPKAAPKRAVKGRARPDAPSRAAARTVKAVQEQAHAQKSPFAKAAAWVTSDALPRIRRAARKLGGGGEER
jgi:hypothetical protein